MTPTQQLIAKLRECETELPKLDGAAWEDKMIELANSNPTVIAMLERAIDVLKFIMEESDCDREADDRVKDECWAALADINALAREAMEEKTDGKA